MPATCGLRRQVMWFRVLLVEWRLLQQDNVQYITLKTSPERLLCCDPPLSHFRICDNRLYTSHRNV